MHVDIDVLSNPLFPDDKHVLSPLPVHILHSKALSGSPCFCFWEIVAINLSPSSPVIKA